MTNTAIEHEEIWFEIEVSAIGDNDWFSVSNMTADTLESARRRLHGWINAVRDTDEREYRIVRKRLTFEVVA